MAASYKPAGLPDLLPYLTVKNVANSIKFYQDAFGFEVKDIAYDDNKNPMHVEMRYGEAVIMFCAEGAHDMPTKAPITMGVLMPISLYLYCADVDSLYDQAIKAGAISRMPPEDRFWGDRMCAVADLDHYEWSFGTHIGVKN